jgi:hypothetical protein
MASLPVWFAHQPPRALGIVITDVDLGRIEDYSIVTSFLGRGE